MVYRTAPFSMILNDPNPDFKVTLNISKMAKDTANAIVTIYKANSKLYPLFQMVPFSMTLSDL